MSEQRAYHTACHRIPHRSGGVRVRLGAGPRPVCLPGRVSTYQRVRLVWDLGVAASRSLTSNLQAIAAIARGRDSS
jgi:hypothetical protein